jgi:hypothetical protein
MLRTYSLNSRPSFVFSEPPDLPKQQPELMHSLQELVDVVTKNKVKSIRTLQPCPGKEKDMIHDFYDRLCNHEFADDATAALFYGYPDEKSRAYRKQRSKLEERLINSSFFIDTGSAKFNTHQKAFYSCQKNLLAIRILIGRNARKAALQIAKDTIRQSEKYEISEITLELYRILRQHYAVNTRDKKSYERSVQMADYYQKVVDAENLVSKFYEHTCIILNREPNAKRKVIELCNRYELELKPLLKLYNCYRLHLIYYFIILRRVTLEANQEQILYISDQAISFFKTKRFISDQFIGAFHYNKLMAMIRLKNYKSGQLEAQKCLAIFEADSVRWFTSHQYCFIFSLYSRRYSKALNLRQVIMNSKSLGSQFQNRQETWRINDAFLYYLMLLKMLPSKNSPISAFRIKKFLNEVPVFSTDKSGKNIPILIIQILIQIQQKKYVQLTDKIEAIEKYTSRYLRKDNNYRSNCFIKMLLQIPRQNFNRPAVEKHTRKLLEKLKAVPLEKANQPFEIEIIPYDDLWEMALESLG